jgi:hypothetical protein
MRHLFGRATAVPASISKPAASSVHVCGSGTSVTASCGFTVLPRSVHCVKFVEMLMVPPLKGAM